jgi:feruloyl esterase
VIEAAIQKQCDAVDNVSDGLIQNPARCSFDPDSLVPNSLTRQQADALKLIIKPVSDEKGHNIYPGSSVSNLGQFGSSPGGPINELETPPTDPAGAKPWGSAGIPTNWNLAIGIISNLGYYDSATDLNNKIESNGVVKSAAFKLLYDRLEADIPADPAKLKAFLGRGGKLLIYHGFNDLVISPYRSIWFYEDLAEKNGGYGKIQGQVRLFMVPGMQHCTGGSGPNIFETLSPLENWVEKGVAPDGIVASHSEKDVIDRTMPLCKFPELAKYNGSGDVKDATNWSCPQDDQSLLMNGPNGVQAGVGTPVRGGVRISARTPVKNEN